MISGFETAHPGFRPRQFAVAVAVVLVLVLVLVLLVGCPGPPPPDNQASADPANENRHESNDVDGNGDDADTNPDTPDPDSRVLVVGLAELDYPPFYFEDEDGFHGAALETADAVARACGYRLEFRRYPWRRVQALLKTGGIDMVILYFRTPEREADVVYTDVPHIYESSWLFVLDESDLTHADLDAMTGLRFGNVRGYSHGPAYDHGESLDRHEVTDESALIGILLAGRVDVAVGNRPAIQLYARRLGVEGRVRFLEPPIHTAPNYLAFSRARPGAKELAARFTAGLERFMKTETYSTILATHRMEADR